MKRFKNILLYTGGEVAPTVALDRAATLAESNGARLTLLDVLPDEGKGPWMTLPGRVDLERMLVVARQDDLERLAAPLRARDLEVETKVLAGRPFVEIIREVQRRRHDLVMKTAQGGEGALGGLFGSTALHLMRKCPCPVWVVKPNAAERGRVLAAIDPDRERPADDELSRTVLQLASSLARARGLELDIVHAWWLWSESMLRSRRVTMPQEQVDTIVSETGERAEAAVREAVAGVDLEGLPHRVRVVKGTPVQVLIEATRKADVAVLGTLSRAGIAGVLIGNTAERVLREVDCSVLAVKPPGFETPVELPVEDLEMIA